MKLEGRAHIAAPPDVAWQRINDPDVVRRCAPGMQSLEAEGPDRYAAVLEIALPALKGRFTGHVEFLERHPPDRLRVRIDGKGGTGFVRGDIHLALAPADPAGTGGTDFHYSADVQVGGQIARLGQRMISGVTKEMAGQFFEALDRIDATAPGASAAPSPLVAFLQLAWRSLLRVLGLRA